MYRAVSGWSGRVFDGEEEVCGVAGCARIDDVRKAIEDTRRPRHFLIDNTRPLHYFLSPASCCARAAIFLTTVC